MVIRKHTKPLLRIVLMGRSVRGLRVNQSLPDVGERANLSEVKQGRRDIKLTCTRK